MTAVITAILLVLVGTVSAVAAVGAWRAARQSSVATETLAGIERDRWHTELTPRFDVRATRVPGGDRATLTVTLTGPPGLDSLDELTVTIRDDDRDHHPKVLVAATAEQIDQQVWGPYRFASGVDEADPNGRSVAPVLMLMGNGRLFALERTRAPSWTNDVFWLGTYGHAPIRLTLTCRRAPHRPWTVPIEVSVDQDP